MQRSCTACNELQDELYFRNKRKCIKYKQIKDRNFSTIEPTSITKAGDLFSFVHDRQETMTTNVFMRNNYNIWNVSRVRYKYCMFVPHV